MTINQVIQKIVEMRDARNWMQFHNPKNMAISVMLEANEVLEHFKDVDNTESVEYSKKYITEISDELADVATYLLELSHNCELGIDELLKNPEIVDNNPKTLSVSLVLEANELLECFQWKTLEESEQFTLQSKSKLTEKVRNILIVILQFTQYLRVDLAQIMTAKMKKNIAKYPVEKSHGNAKKYNEL